MIVWMKISKFACRTNIGCTQINFETDTKRFNQIDKCLLKDSYNLIRLYLITIEIID